MSHQIIQANQPIFTNRALVKLLVPLIAEQFLAATIGMADTVMVTSVGEAAVSGVSLVDSINMLFIQIFAALSTGGAVVASQYIGRGQREEACHSAKQLLYASGALSLFVTAVCLVLQRMLLRAVFGNIDDTVMQNCETYFWLSALSYPFLALYNSGAALFRSMGNSKVSLFVSLMMNIVNILGNALLIFGFQMGVAGAAIASLVSRVLGAAVILVLCCRKDQPISVSQIFRPEWRPDMVKTILKIGIPSGVENGMFQVGKLMVSSLIATFGTAAIAANAIGNTVSSFITIPGMAIQLGLITVVGQCVGARDYRQAVGYVKKLMLVIYLAMGVFNVLLFLFAGQVVSLFQLSPPAVVEATRILRFFGLCALFLWPVAFPLSNALRAAGDVKFTMVVSMLSMWIFRIGFSYLLGRYLGMGLFGVWIAMVADWVARAVVFLWRFCRGRWKNIQVI